MTVPTVTRRIALTALGASLVLPGRHAGAQGAAKLLKLGALCTQTGPSASIGKESPAAYRSALTPTGSSSPTSTMNRKPSAAWPVRNA